MSRPQVFNDGTGDGVRAVDGRHAPRKGDMTAEARNGYFGNANPHLWSSPCWYAHDLGAMLHRTGRLIPTTGVRMSRGSSMRCGDSVYRFNHDTKGTGGTWERIS